tara:strand:- start:654 stop:956 length:303 start_codon:yes stop_codon:yes gene_type:complete
MMTRDQMIETLQAGLMEITFTKTNGEERVMKCSLHKSFTASLTEAVKKTNERAINEDVIPVWDIEKGGWRSFRVDSITSVKELGGIPEAPKQPSSKNLKE